MRRQAVRLPDALHRGHADAGRLGHGGAGPVGRLVRRLGGGQGHDPVDDLLAERSHPRGTGLVAQPIDPFFGEAFLPAPDAGLGLARPTHDLDGAEAARRNQYDLGPPGMLLRGVRLPTIASRRRRSTALRAMVTPGRMLLSRTAQAHRESRCGFNCQI